MSSVQRIGEVHDQLAVHHTMEVRREEYLDYMTFARNERPLFTEIFGPGPGLKEEWKAQGATPEELDLSAFRYRRAMDGGLPVATGWTGGDPETILEETPQYIIARDRMGRRMKLSRGYATLPLPMDHPVTGWDSWLRIKAHYEFSEARLSHDWEQAASRHREAGRVVSVGIPGGFDEPRQLLGEENLCIACCEQPDLIHDILNTIGSTAERVLDAVSRAVPIDQLFVHEDMAGRSGPLIGPKQVRTFIVPYYRRIWDMLKERGARLFKQDSDGDMNCVIPAFLEAGINVMYPMEPAANMDIVAVREKYGTRLAFLGGIDKHVLRKSREEIVAELEYKIPPMVRSGGCVLGLDHRIPNGTPLESYRFYLEKSWEILEREASAGKSPDVL